MYPAGVSHSSSASALLSQPGSVITSITTLPLADQLFWPTSAASQQVVVDCGDFNCVTLAADSSVLGITFTNGAPAVTVASPASVVLQSCVFKNNVGTQASFGSALLLEPQTITLCVGCQFENNTSSGEPSPRVDLPSVSCRKQRMVAQ